MTAGRHRNGADLLEHLEPPVGFEPTTFRLQGGSSTS